MDTHEKLRHLADASRFDLSCACGTRDNDDHRRRGPGGVWLYPASLPRGGQSIMLKTLLSNACVNDCLYCPFRCQRDTRRYTLAPEEAAEAFMAFVRRKNVHGLFLSSGVVREADYTMDRMLAVARLLRGRHDYRGFLHLKVIPGASDAAMDEALSVAGAVSLNVEVPTRSAFATLSRKKDFDRDIVRPLKRLCRLTGPGMPHRRVKVSTQFVVGAASETDSQIVRATASLYRRWRLGRVYFSAYQRGPGEAPGAEPAAGAGGEALITREHRLYQVDWLLRKYGFEADEIGFDASGNLPLSADPKQVWADRHPQFFPVDLNAAPRQALLRVPGLGAVAVERVLARRRQGRLRSIEDVGRVGKRLAKAAGYVKFGGAGAFRLRPA